MKSLSRTEVDLIKTVNAHLKQLFSLALHNVDEGTVRVASSSLRILLVENRLADAWKASRLGGPMVFETWGIASIKGDDAVAYCGGGDILPGIPFSACHNADVAKRTLNLVDLLKQTRIQVGPHKISTVQLVKYVANTWGGVHFDPEGKSPKSRKPDFALLRRLEAGELGGPPMLVNDRNLLHHELLSIAQAIVRSKQVALLIGWQEPSQ